jgi:hypothetical protein
VGGAHVGYGRSIEAKQPADGKSALFYTVDYDATQSDIDNAILPYAQAFHSTMGKLCSMAGTPNYLLGVYGNGLVCKALMEAGLVHFSWLSESTGFGGYQMWLPHADIIQIEATTMFGIDVDTNFRRSAEVGAWKAVA